MPSRKQREPSLESLFRLVEHADLEDDPNVQQLLAVATVVDDIALKRQIEQVLAAKAVERQRQPFDNRVPRLSPLTDQLSLGTTITGSRYDLEQGTLTQHLLAVGQSGSGKTTLFYNLMDQLSVPFWAFDLKQDYRHLLHEKDLLILPWQELRFNPLQPPQGVPPQRWAQIVAEIFGHATALLSGSKNFLMSQLIDLYRDYDVFKQDAGPYPSLHDLQTAMNAEKINYVRKQANYRDTVVNRLKAMTRTAGPVFACSTGFSLEELLQRNVVFEFDGLSRDLQNFLMEILFAAVYEYRVAQNQRGGNLRHVFFLDEGKQVFSVYKERQDAAGLPAVDELTAKMREFGEGLVVADQEATKLTDSIKANTATKLLLAVGDAKQFDEIAASMQLSERQRDVAQTLGTGDAIVQAGHRNPCPVRLDNYELEKTISDAVLQKRQQEEWAALSWSKRVPRSEVVGEATPSEADSDEASETDAHTVEITLSTAATQLLNDFIEHPFRKLTDRYDQFSSTYKGDQAKQELIDAGVVEEVPVTTGRGTRTLFELTETGREYVESSLKVDTKQRGRGGIEHRYWQHRIKKAFEEAGWPAKRELFDADVYVNMHDMELVVEIAMGVNDREIEHVDQHLVKGFDAIWVVCRTDEVRTGLKERLKEDGLLDERVNLRLTQEIGDTEDMAMAKF